MQLLVEFLFTHSRMSETPEQNVPVDEAQAPVGGADVSALQAELDLLRASNQKKLNELKNQRASNEDLQRKFQELQASQHQKDQAQLAQAGNYQKLWEDQKSTVTDLQSQVAQRDQIIEQMKIESQQQQIKVTALNAIAQSGAVNSDQAYQLLQNDLRMKDGELIALAGGVEVPINQRLDQLKQPGSGWEHHFSGSGARGMSAAGSSSSAAGGASWSSMGLMERIQLEEENPQLAAQLKAAG